MKISLVFIQKNRYTSTEELQVKIGIISMVNLNDGPFYLDSQMTETIEELMELFEKALTKIVSDLYDTGVDFEHDVKSDYCDYCGE